jgi:hypothetical protein
MPEKCLTCYFADRCRIVIERRHECGLDADYRPFKSIFGRSYEEIMRMQQKENPVNA